MINNKKFIIVIYLVFVSFQLNSDSFHIYRQAKNVGYGDFRYDFSIYNIDSFISKGYTTYIKSPNLNHYATHSLSLFTGATSHSSTLKMSNSLSNNTYSTSIYRWYPFSWRNEGNYSYVIIVDNNAPEHQLKYLPTLAKINETNDWYNSKHFSIVDLTLTTSNFEDVVGTSHSKWLEEPNTTILDKYNIKIQKEGTTTVYYDMTDYLGNTFPYPYTVKIDISNPKLVNPSLVKKPIILVKNSPDEKTFGFYYDWEKVLDMPFTTEDKEGVDFSGVYEYQLRFNEIKNDFSKDPIGITKTIGGIDNPDFLNTSTTLTLEDLESGIINREKIYYPSIQVQDFAMNLNENVSLPPFSIPLPAKIEEPEDSIYKDPIYDSNLNEVTYPVELKIRLYPRAVDFNYGIKEVKLYLLEDVDLGNKIRTHIDTIMAPTLGESGEIPANLTAHYKDGKIDYYNYNYNFVLDSVIHAHKYYEYEVETVHQFRTNENEDFKESQIYTPRTNDTVRSPIRVKNLEISELLAFNIYSESSGELLAKIDTNGNIYNENTNTFEMPAQDNLFTNSGVFIQLEMLTNNLSNAVDPEQDRISFRISSDKILGELDSSVDETSPYSGEVVYIKNDYIPGTQVLGPNDNSTHNLVIVDRNSEFIGQYENPQIINFNLQKDQAIDGDFEPKLEHMLSSIDLNPYLPTGGLSEDSPTNKLDKLNLSITNISDSQSGIKSVKVYNLSTIDFNASGLTTGDDPDNHNSSIFPTLVPKEEIFTLESNDTTYTMENYSLLNEVSDLRYVIVVVEDFALNRAYKVLVIAYDNTPPDISQSGFTFSREHLADDVIKLSANFIEKDNGFRYIWNSPYIDLENVNNANLNTDFTSNYICVDTTPDPIRFPGLNDLGVNELQEIPLIIADKAGNISQYAGQFCTFPFLDGNNLTLLEGELDNSGNHILKWQGTVTNESSSYRLERILSDIKSLTIPSENQQNGFVHILDGQQAIDENGLTYNLPFDEKLKAHKTYTYRLYAVNQLGEIDVNAFILLERTLINNEPSPLELRSPLNSTYTTLEPKFTFYLDDNNSPLDPDGDEVKYSLYIKDESGIYKQIPGNHYGEGDVQSTLNWAIDYPNENSPFQLEHDKIYTWKILSEDSFDTSGLPIGEEYQSKSVFSAESTFTVDKKPPFLTYVYGDDHPIYHSSNVLKINTLDLGSGIEPGSIKVEIKEDGLENIYPTVYVVEENVFESVLPDGNYNLAIWGSDKAGNISEVNESDVWIDSNSPQFSGGFKIDGQTAGQVVVSVNEIEVEFIVKDILSGLKTLSYRYISEKGHEVVGQLSLSESDGIGDTYKIKLPLSGLMNRTLYSLELETMDKAGNVSPVLNNPLLDLMQNVTIPEVSIKMTNGFTAAAGGIYVSDLSLVVTETELDVVLYGITETHYAIKDWNEAGNPLVWQTNLENVLTNSVLIDGRRYSIAVKVVNFLGLSKTSFTNVFIYDNSAPIDLSITGISSEPYSSCQTLRFEVNGLDDHSTIASYKLKIGNNQDQYLLTSRVNGQRQGVLVKETGDGNVFSFAIPETDQDLPEGLYDIVLEAVNGAGLTTVFDQNQLLIDNSLDRVIVSDSSIFTSDKVNIKGKWLFRGDKTPSYYRFALLKDSENRTPLENEWISTVETNVSLIRSDTELLEEGETYKFFVQAFFSDETYTGIFSNMGVTVDSTPINFKNDKLLSPQYSDERGLWLGWDLEDKESGIQSIEVFVDKLLYDEHGEVLYSNGDFPQPLYERLTKIDMPSKGFALGHNINSDSEGQLLDLKTGDHIYLILRATNGSGLVSDRRSEVIIIDRTAPPVPIVMDQALNIRPTEKIRSNWLWTEEDKESGNKSYQWKVYNSKNGIDSTDWSVPSLGMELPELGAYSLYGMNEDLIYVAVKVTNGAGLESIGISRGVRLDDLAPEMSFVNLWGTTGTVDQRYINKKNNLTLNIQASDLQTSLIDMYHWSYGSINEYGQWEELQSTQLSRVNEFKFNLKESISSGDILVFEANSTDLAGNISTQAYSKGVMYDDSKPTVLNVNGYLSGDILYFDWDSSHIKAPIIGYNYSLKKLINKDTNNFIEVLSGRADEKRFAMDISDPNFEDNFYILNVIAETASANWSLNSVSNVVMVDKSAPEISQFLNNKFTSTKVDFEITAYEPTSRITEFQYSVGTFEDPTTISAKWISEKTGANRIEDIFYFKDLPGGNASVIDGTELYVRVRVKNSAGLWSPIHIGEKILVDKSPAIVDFIGIAKSITISEIIYELNKAYTSNSSAIEQIILTTSDEQSGISAYQFGIVKAGDLNEESVLWGPIKSVPEVAENTPYIFNETDLYLSGLNLLDKGLYCIAVKTFNGSEDPSLIAFSNDVTADFVAPELVFKPELSSSPLAGNFYTELLEDNINRIISNGGQINIAYKLNEETSERVFIQFEQILPTQAIEIPNELQIVIPEFETPYIFSKTDGDGYGEYIIVARLTDAAGNYVDEAHKQRVRLNSPPLITLTDVITTPGKLLTFKLEESAEDDDNPLDPYWVFGNGLESNNSIVSTTYEHKKMWDSESDYALTLRVSDAYGKSSTKTVNAKVINTKVGQLYVNEYWSGEHTMIGTVVVPEGLELHVKDETNVLISGTVDTIEEFGLHILGNLYVGDNAQFTVHKDSSEFLWQGILVKGLAEIGESNISRAIRGLTIEPSGSAALIKTSFSFNNIGIHGIGSTFILDDLKFVNNYEYAIKEDGYAIPYVKNCWFEDNTYDYYDGALTAIDFQKLNELGSNSNNRGKAK